MILLCVLTAACSPDAERHAPTPVAGPEVETVQALMVAFNAHDADKMREYWADDLVWVELSGDQSSIITTSADQLHQEMVGYFKAFPSVASKVSSISTNGRFLSAVEETTWDDGGEPQRQSAIVVYEIEDQKVVRFWYYPSVRQ